MVQLRPHLTVEEFVNRVQQQQQAGYQLAYIAESPANLGQDADEKVRAIAGFRIIENLAFGRVLYVDDLITDEQERSQGYGKALLDWLTTYGQQQHCDTLELDSGSHRTAAHRFYFRERLVITGFHFQRSL